MKSFLPYSTLIISLTSKMKSFVSQKVKCDLFHTRSLLSSILHSYLKNHVSPYMYLLIGISLTTPDTFLSYCSVYHLQLLCSDIFYSINEIGETGLQSSLYSGGEILVFFISAIVLAI